MANLLDFLTDDEGIFQGGKEGRFLGRFRDKQEPGGGGIFDPRTVNPYAGMSEMEIANEQLRLNPNNVTMQAGATRLANPDEAANLTNLSEADAQAGFRERLRTQDFTNISGDEMGNIQSWLNKQGFTDWEGKELDEDQQFGPRTLSAIRKAQGEVFNPTQKQITGGDPDIDGNISYEANPTFTNKDLENVVNSGQSPIMTNKDRFGYGTDVDSTVDPATSWLRKKWKKSMLRHLLYD